MTENQETDVLSFLKESFNVNQRPVSEKSILAKLVPLEKEPAALIYGPSKSGKTRMVVWEGAALASALNRRLLAIFTESNMELEDFTDLIYICMYHNVQCELVKLDHLTGIRRYIQKFNRTITRLAQRKPEELEAQPKVIAIDSLTALSELVTSSLSEGILDNPQSIIAYQNPYQIAIIDPIRRVISQHMLNGFLLLTAHETQTRGEPYNPAVTAVKAKPRYSSAGRYKEDLEIYFTNEVHDNLKTCKESKEPKVRKYLRALIVVRSRRNPDYEGRGVAILLERTKGTTEGYIEVSTSPGNVVYKYIPKDMMESGTPRTFTYNALTPRIVCGPKYI